MEIKFDKKVAKAKWIRFVERKDGQDFYAYGNMEYGLGCNCAYQLNDDFYRINTNERAHPKASPQKYYITQETKARFLAVYNDLMSDIDSIKREGNGFYRADFGDKYIGWKPLGKGLYQIIAVNEKENTIYQTFSGLYDFLTHFDFDVFSPALLPFDAIAKIAPKVKDGTFPLLVAAKKLGEKFLEYELKYFCDCATQEEVEYLNSVDGKHRFIPVPRIENIEIVRCSKMSKTLLNHLDKYLLTVIMDNNERFAVYYPSIPNRLFVFRYPKDCKIEVESDIIEKYLAENQL